MSTVSLFEGMSKQGRLVKNLYTAMHLSIIILFNQEERLVENNMGQGL